MKTVISTIAITLTSATVLAQNPVNPADTIADTDTTDVEELQEIVVKAPKVVHKADMDLYFPSKSAVEHSKNGLTLLRNIMIPTLIVNDVMGTITVGGQAVEVRINGRKATIRQVKELLPETIKRIEWIDNPGLKYNGATAVVNFLVQNPDSGGALMLEAIPALNVAWGTYNGNLKINNGRSQWEFGGQYKLTNNLSVYRDYAEKFKYPDGSSLSRTEEALGGNLSNTFGDAHLSYSYVKPDTTTIYVSLYAERNFNTEDEHNGLMTMSDNRPQILLQDISGQNGTTPYFNAYLEQRLPHNQSIIVDMGASWYMGRAYSTYVERDATAKNVITDVTTDIYDRNQSYAIEANYLKRWKYGRLTAGASYQYKRNRSQYDNIEGAIYHQRQDNAYFFSEYFHRINKVSLTAGLGAQYTSFKFTETEQGNDKWTVMPTFGLTYAINQKHQLRLDFRSWNNSPSLMQTNITSQQLDGFQWRIGNPNLKSYSTYRLALYYNFMIPRVMGRFAINALSSPKAIASYMYWDNDRLVTSYENSRGYQRISFSLSPQIEVIPQWLTISGTIEYRAERMRGLNYTHYNHNWAGDVAAQMMYRGFSLMIQYKKANRSLWGENISWGEDLSIVMLNYDWKNWRFGGGVIMPFGKYDQGSRELNQYNTNETHSRLDMRIPYVSISYNLQWGRQKRGINKRINANTETDRSSAGGR